ncbi:inositol 2-dehydrogenase [Candidatus Bipolaricaulota bacterium]|nr:inositol 2-dehydrogenase [Candidatus Bipolaricaulota bacterium]
MAQVKIGILGAGRIGKVHAENLIRRVPEAEVVAIADVRREAAERCAAELGIPRAYGDPRPLLDDRTVDAVFICTSTDTHAPLIEEAAKAGKHIFCEKPIALDLGAIDRALATVNRAGVKFMVGFNRRFDPNFARARELVAEGAIGRPHILRITSRDPEPPPLEYVKSSGGIFLDMTIHDFDMARFMVGDEVIEVYALGSVLVDKRIGELGDVDTTVVTLRFASGAIGVIDNSRRAVYGYDQRVEVFGERGMIRVDNPRLDTAVQSDAQGDHATRIFHFFMDRYTESFVREARAFTAAVLEDTKPPVTGEDGKIPVVMAYAAKRSLEEHRPVRLEEVARGG